MADMPSAFDLVLAALTDDDRDAAVRHLRGASDPAALLAQVARSRSPGPRGYVARLAVELLPVETSIPLVRKMLDDPDSDNRADAVAVYMALNPDGMPRILGKLRRRLRSMSDHEVLATAWTLAALRDDEAAAAIAEVRDVEPPDRWLHKALDVVWTYISSPDRVITRIQEHDHDSMKWLAYAATLIGTAEATTALRECSMSAPDDRCRMVCQTQFETVVTGAKHG
jgi:hypothetical protein